MINLNSTFLKMPSDLLKIIANYANRNGSLSLVNKRLNAIVDETFATLNIELLKSLPPISERFKLNTSLSPKKNFQLLMNVLHKQAKRMGCDIEFATTFWEAYAPLSHVDSYIKMNRQHSIARELVSNLRKNYEPYHEAFELYMARFLPSQKASRLFEEIKDCKKSEEIWKILRERNIFNIQVGKIQLRDTGIPFLSVDYCSLVHLQKLDLTRNPISELPEKIGDLTNLVKLAVAFCKLTSIPATIGNLTRLKKLCLDHNELKEIPASIGNLKALRTLTLDSNKISVLPAQMSELSLTQFTIGNNPIAENVKSIPTLKNGKPILESNCLVM